ncbi:hypothetical protein GQ600_15026 [Phytophthora cactorum]|nr:hypothetical protein GQ600_15026 [Phytophthora cactorum]
MKKRRRQSQDKYRRNQRLDTNESDHPVHDDSVSDFSDAESETTQCRSKLQTDNLGAARTAPSVRRPRPAPSGGSESPSAFPWPSPA